MSPNEGFLVGRLLSQGWFKDPLEVCLASCPWTKSSMHFVHLKTSGFLRVLRTRDRIVRSNTWFIHSLLGTLPARALWSSERSPASP